MCVTAIDLFIIQNFALCMENQNQLLSANPSTSILQRTNSTSALTPSSGVGPVEQGLDPRRVQESFDSVRAALNAIANMVQANQQGSITNVSPQDAPNGVVTQVQSADTNMQANAGPALGGMPNWIASMGTAASTPDIYSTDPTRHLRVENVPFDRARHQVEHLETIVQNLQNRLQSMDSVYSTRDHMLIGRNLVPGEVTRPVNPQMVVDVSQLVDALRAAGAHKPQNTFVSILQVASQLCSVITPLLLLKQKFL